MKIKNFQQLAVSNLRRTALEIVEAGLEAIDTAKVIQKNVRLEGEKLVVKEEHLSLKNIQRLLVVGVGKCSLEAAQALEKILQKRITDGIVLDVKPGTLEHLQVYAGDHPFPTQRNIEVTKKIIDLLSGLTEHDLVIFIISGGGSTLLCQPPDLTSEDETNILGYLFKAGADIKKINAVRKHLSLARGGYLAQYAYPAKVISLIFSDVPGNNLEFVASGPTIKDKTTIKDAEKVIAEYNIKEHCQLPGVALVETPKDNKYFKKVKNIVIISNEVALKAMQQKAQELGFGAQIRTTNLSGEAREVGPAIAEELKKAAPKTALLYGGETTVTVTKAGKGGRNIELGLSALRFIENGQILIPVASDGRDNTDIAGAVCDMITKEKAQKRGFDLGEYLEENQSYKFFTQLEEHLNTGDTGSNVSDLIVVLKE